MHKRTYACTHTRTHLAALHPKRLGHSSIRDNPQPPLLGRQVEVERGAGKEGEGGEKKEGTEGGDSKRVSERCQT